MLAAQEVDTEVLIGDSHSSVDIYRVLFEEDFVGVKRQVSATFSRKKNV